MNKVNNYMIALAFMQASYLLSRPGEWNKPGREQFICNALRTAHKQGMVTRAQRDAAIAVIEERIDWHGTLDSWLIDNGHLDASRTMEEYFDDIQDYRRRWLDSLRIEFLNKDR